jgi:ferritin-like metal-binding protein YciE
MSINSLRDLFFDQLRDLYSVEDQLSEAISVLERESASHELRELFANHAATTRGQRERLLVIARKHGEEIGGDTSKAMRGLIEGGEEHIAKVTDPMVKDALIIAHATRVENYEMAAYGVARSIAESLELNEEADLLAESYVEEVRMEAALRRLAIGSLFRSGINDRAAESAPVELE